MSELAALRDLRRTRQRRRLGEIEWFDAAYKVYLVGLFGGGGFLWLSNALGNEPVGSDTVAAVARHAPGIVGMLAVLAVLAGLRGGAQGGPLALEAADVTVVMMSPVDRRAALLRPAWQRLRSAAAMGALIGAAAGQLTGQRLHGGLWAWAFGGAASGLTIALLWVGSALVAHNWRLPLAVATAIGLALVAVQGAAIAWKFPGPGHPVGRLALWGMHRDPLDLLALLGALAVVALGVVRLGRTSLDALSRRSSLVAQLRFAVTMQDLRTVILLRRQLNNENPRGRPWVRLRPGAGAAPRPAIVRRGLHGLLRLPVGRVLRMVVLAAAIGVTLAMAARGAVPMLALGALGLFLLSLEANEALSQEVDQPNYTDSYPIERGMIMQSHLIVAAIALIPLAVIAAVAAALTLQRAEAIAAIAIVAVPVAWAGACGGVVSIVKDLPDPYSAANQQAFMPPEMAGMGTAVRTLIPLIVSGLGCAPILLVRQAAMRGESLTQAALRSLVGCALLIAATVTWVGMRDRVSAAWRKFLDEGRNYQPARRPTTAKDDE